MPSRSWFTLAGSIVFGFASASASAQSVHAGDVLLRSAGDQITSGASLDGTLLTFPFRVFSNELGKLGPELPNRTPDPGYNTVEGSFLPNATVSLMIRRAARRWTPLGNATGHFCVVPGEALQVRKSGFTIQTPVSDPANGQGPSIVLGFSDGSGFMHEHPAYWLTTPFSNGVYLLELSVVAEASGVTITSDPYWILFSQNASSVDVQDSFNWVVTRVANVAGVGGSLCPPACAADFDQNSSVNVGDIFSFLSAWFSRTASANFNGDGATDVQDIFAFLAAWFARC